MPEFVPFGRRPGRGCPPGQHRHPDHDYCHDEQVEHRKRATYEPSGNEPLHVMLDYLRRKGQPRDFLDAARRCFRAGDPRLHDVGRHLQETARRLYGNDRRGAAESFEHAVQMVERLTRTQRLGLAARIARKVAKDVTGAGAPTVAADVYTPVGGSGTAPEPKRRHLQAEEVEED